MTIRPWAPLACAALLMSVPAWSQYKVVGPDGKVTYTDRPPATQPATQHGKAAAKPGEGSGEAGLPYVLRTAVSRFPVVLYTTPACEPCDRGRDLLRTRGVPFREKVASSSADIEAWNRQIGSQQAPVLSVGGQMLRGFAVDSWNSYLDVAGYPRESRLPANYTAPPPQPLAERAPPPPPTEPAPAPRAPEPPPPPASGGIRF
ncbi:glutaredoxin family protein [Ideonella sp. BN130291]|uniref:glutaredoxin family protein n=1 Tax=Ideonella sp. BN130291 TaxID=3112940 RepID=UPI002E260853|nr:glutaredoxin family protein [Ideonella sp. BN130291]